jgi:D-arabinose 1-dehydrogenase-like Zn-dependent alcohol dehydrogenase
LLAVGPNRKDLEAITALCEIGQVVPAIDGRYSLNAFREAFARVAEGRAKGRVVISLEDGGAM